MNFELVLLINKSKFSDLDQYVVYHSGKHVNLYFSTQKCSRSLYTKKEIQRKVENKNYL